MTNTRPPVPTNPKQTAPHPTDRARDHHDLTTDNPIFNDHITDQNHQPKKHDDRPAEARSNKSKNETHTHASRSCGARRGPWRARCGTRSKITLEIAGAGSEEAIVKEPIERNGTSREQAERALDAARRPTERAAAIMLAQVQRDLSLAWATTPAEIAGEPGVDDPETAYVAWVALLTDSERQLRESAVAAVESWRRDDDSPHPARAFVEVEFATKFVDAVAPARAAITAMAGPDRTVARAAQHDVLVRWPADDRAAEAALAARFPDPDGEA